MTSLASLVMTADQIYPSTLTRYRIVVQGSGGSVTIGPGDAAAVAPLSAGGQLTIAASDIVQGGVLRAPFGTISLISAGSLTLAPRSVTSTAGPSGGVLFGQTEFAETWVYPLTGGRTLIVDGTPDKRVQLDASEIFVEPEAVIDIAGGGDLLAYEFQKGPGGSRDTLVGNNSDGSFAILPVGSNLFGQYDPIESTAAGIQPGSTIQIGAGGPVPPGEYARLPARYALLPGAYLVVPVKGFTDIQPGNSGSSLGNEYPVVAGRLGFAGTDISGQRWNGYAVLTSVQALDRSEYRISRASTFFTDAQGRPADDGSLALFADTALRIGGILRTEGPAGRDATVDIVARDLAIVSARSAGSQRVELLDSELQLLGAASLLIGGSRVPSDEGVIIDAASRSVAVDSGVNLETDELLLAATGSITVASGASISSTGNAAASATPGERLLLAGDAALVALTADPNTPVERISASGQSGRIDVQSGATLRSNGDVILDSPRDLSVDGTVDAHDGVLRLDAASISFGAAPGATGGLVLTQEQLARFDASGLDLRSGSTIDFRIGTALNYRTIALDSAGLRGYLPGAATVTLTAENVALSNSTQGGSFAPGIGTGRLVIDTGSLLVSEGNVDVSGFSGLSAQVEREVFGQGQSGLMVHGDLALATPRITASSGATLVLAADGTLRADALPSPTNQDVVTSLGAQVAMYATAIDLATRIDAPSGRVTATASGIGGIGLRGGSVINVAGRVVNVAGVTADSPGGSVSLVAENGAVTIADGAAVDVSGGGLTGRAGSISIVADRDTLEVSAGALLRGDAGSGAERGSFSARVARLGESGFSGLNSLLNAGSFEQRRAVSLGEGDLIVAAGDVVRAAEVELTADAGLVRVGGLIDARAEDGGLVRLYARDALVIEGTGRIDASATSVSGHGGRVELGTTVGSIDIQPLQPAASASDRINVSGRSSTGAPEPTGNVLLRAPRTVAGDDVAIRQIAAVTGARRVDIEAFQSYQASIVNDSLLMTIAADNAAFMGYAPNIVQRLGLEGDPRYQVLPGVEIRSPGDLSVDVNVDLINWRYDGRPGVLTLRAAENLLLNRSISDGFVRRSADEALPDRDFADAGLSWTFRLIAGSNVAGADPRAVGDATGDLRLGSDVVVRTGTGRIEASAAGDIRFGGGRSAIYSAGRNRGTGALSAFDAEILLRGDFVQEGGDVRLFAGGDILAASVSPLPDWLPRAAGEYSLYQEGVVYPTAWAIAVDNFQQGVGALGGGSVSVQAGGSIDSLVVAAPVNGLPAAFDGSRLEIAGGGNLVVRAGGDVRGGMFHVGRGQADIRSNGQITAGTATGLLPFLQISDGRAYLEGLTGVGIQSTFDPMVAPQNPRQGLPDFAPIDQPVFFFTYTDSSAVELLSVTGDSLLQANATGLAPLYLDRQIDPALLTAFPGQIRARSLGGNVVVDGRIDALPFATGNLDLLASGNVTVGEVGQIYLSDADPRLLPSASNPVQRLDGVLLGALLAGNAPTPIHQGDTRRASLIAGIDVGTSGVGRLTVSVPKPATVRAGRDVTNLSLFTQHLVGTDATLVEAGRDFKFVTVRRPDGNIGTGSGVIDVAGPGRLDVIAGRNVDIGTAVGFQTRGNLSNQSLPDNGADINVWVGQQSPADLAGFTQKYLVDVTRHAEALSAYLQPYPQDPSLTDVENFKALSVEDRRPFIQQVLFAELLAGGLDDTDQGFDAIETLFPVEDGYSGDLKSYLSRITTLDGGNINLVVPGGLVNAGVASSGSISKSPDQLGIVTQGLGNISGFVDGDFLVNSSRVFALNGGDVLIWSSEGDIDAGRGPRAALVIPPPRISFDAQGNLVIEFPPSISGSGIRTAVTTEGREPGDVYLFAPSGVVDAGDAGIFSAGNVTVVATQVIGADNIVAGGVSVGVPVQGGIGVSVAGASSASSSAANAADMSGAEGESQQSPGLADSALSWLDVFVVGLGEESCDPKDLECLRRQKKQ
jgi:hypothetical protein